MCGICGFIGKGSLDDLASMNDTMIHRGPDAEGFFHDAEQSVFLAHRRLSIIDLSGGSQPMTTRNGNLTITFNGEIYNHEDLRSQLERTGHQFQSSHSDTEVLLHGFQQWGDRLPERLNGMWAFAIYDKKRRQLFLSRDRFGKKPLFYSLQGTTFVFASELSALIKHPGITAAPSTLSLQKYFAYGYIPAPNSLYENIYKLPAGCSLRVSVDNRYCATERYWDFVLEPFENIPENPEEEWGEELRSLLAKAVKRRMMSDVPLGVFLSGGIDSSAVSYYASQSLPPRKLKTFSIGFDEPTFDESTYSSLVARLLDTEHHHTMLSFETALSLLPDIGSKLDEPMGDSSLVPTYLLCKETRKLVTVALGGDGADELFAGYDPLHALARARQYQRLVPGPMHAAVRMMVSRFPTSLANMSLDFKLKRTLRGLSYPEHLWNPVWQGAIEPRDLRKLFGGPVDLEAVYSEAIEQWDTCRQTNIVDRTLQFYTKLYLQDDILVKIDRASMMNSLEVRAPFLDIDLVNFVRRIPNEWKFRNGQTKYILKKALEPVLPKEILYRSKKGFGVPVGKWLNEGRLTIDTAHSPSLLNRKFIEKRLQAHRRKRSDERSFLWNLWVLEKILDRTRPR